MMPRFIALVPAAGSGSRMRADCPKQYLLLHGKPVLWHSLKALHAEPRISRIVLVLTEGDPWFARFDWSDLPRLQVLYCGGASRAETVRNGLADIASNTPDDPWILVHDAARPCLSRTDLTHLIDQLQTDAVGGLLAVPVPETVKRATLDGHVAQTVPRQDLWLAQTPQMFRLRPLLAAHQGVLDTITDEASAMERQGDSPRLITGSRNNLKITYPEDLALAALLLPAADPQHCS